jgi:hypothetical protein
MNQETAGAIEPFFTLKETAERLHLKYWLVLRAANAKIFPVYFIGNRRKRVLLSEVVAAIRAGAR